MKNDQFMERLAASIEEARAAAQQFEVRVSALLERAERLDPASPDGQPAQADALRIEAEVFAWQSRLMGLRAEMAEVKWYDPRAIGSIDDAQALLFDVEDGLIWARAALLRPYLPERRAWDPLEPGYESPAESQR